MASSASVPLVKGAQMNAEQGNEVVVVGKVTNVMGDTMILQTFDHTVVRVKRPAADAVSISQTAMVHGRVLSTGLVEEIMAFDLGDKFDLDVYEKMLCVQARPEFAGIFS